MSLPSVFSLKSRFSYWLKFSLFIWDKCCLLPDAKHYLLKKDLLEFCFFFMLLYWLEILLYVSNKFTTSRVISTWVYSTTQNLIKNLHKTSHKNYRVCIYLSKMSLSRYLGFIKYISLLVEDFSSKSVIFNIEFQ